MKKILVVEDDHALRSNVVDILESVDYKVFSVADGKSAITLADEISPNLIISDITMPGMTGYEVLKEIMKNEKLAAVPFVFLTAKATLQDIRNGMEMGADDYIVKPFKAKELIAAINTRLKKYERLNPPQFNIQEKTLSNTSIVKTEEKKTILVNDGGKPKIIKTDNIIAITADGEYTKVFLNHGENLFVRKLLKKWEENLSQDSFIRIHRSTMININFLAKIDRVSQRAYIVYLENLKKPFTISERYAIKLKKDIGF